MTHVVSEEATSAWHAAREHPDGVSQRDLPNHTVRISIDLWQRLRDLALRWGYRNTAGRRAGEGNVTAMLTDIARGRLDVVRGDDPHA